MAQIKTKFIANNAVSNAKLAQMPTLTIKGNDTGGTANAKDLTVAEVNAILGNISSALASGYILVGSAGGVATAVTMSGEATIVASGAVTLSNSAVIGKLLTGFSAGSGYSALAATDSILAAFQKVEGGLVAIKATADAALPSASFTDTAVTGKLITGYVSGAGTVAATDTILQAIQKLNGNTAAKLSNALTSAHIFVGNVSDVATDVAMSGEASIDNTGAVTLSNAAVIGKVLTGYVSGAGTVAATDSILQAIQKLNGNQANYLPLAGGTMSGNIAMGGNKITGSADPSSAQDLVTLAYMNARLNGLKPKQSVRAATTVAGTLATDFANSSVIDTVTLATGDRILIKDQAAPAENGIYTVNVSGAPTRAADFDSVSPIDEINGAWVAVQEGGQAGKILVQYGTVTTIDTDAINFEYFNPIAGLIGGDMITFSSSTFSVDLATVSGLESSNPGNVAGQLRIKLEASNPSLQIDGSNQLGIKFDSTGALQKGAGGTSVKVDAATVKINGSNSLEALKHNEESITLTGTDITNQYVDLAYAVYGASASVNSVGLNVDGGPKQKKTVDYTVSLTGGSGGVTRITFAGDLATAGAAELIAGDILIIDYDYLT